MLQSSNFASARLAVTYAKRGIPEHLCKSMLTFCQIPPSRQQASCGRPTAKA